MTLPTLSVTTRQMARMASMATMLSVAVLGSAVTAAAQQGARGFVTRPCSREHSGKVWRVVEFVGNGHHGFSATIIKWVVIFAVGIPSLYHEPLDHSVKLGVVIKS